MQCHFSLMSFSMFHCLCHYLFLTRLFYHFIYFKSTRLKHALMETYKQILRKCQKKKNLSLRVYKFHLFIRQKKQKQEEIGPQEIFSHVCTFSCISLSPILKFNFFSWVSITFHPNPIIPRGTVRKSRSHQGICIVHFGSFEPLLQHTVDHQNQHESFRFQKPMDISTNLVLFEQMKHSLKLLPSYVPHQSFVQMTEIALF